MPQSKIEYTLLKYGNHSINLPITFPHICKILEPSCPTAIVKIDEYINKVMDSPIDSEPFDNIFKEGNKVVITISDITRYALSETYLPVIIDRLNKTGIDDKHITIVCALGIHRKQTAQEHRKLVGANIYKRIKILDHDAFSKNNLSLLGQTRRGTPIEVNHLITKA